MERMAFSIPLLSSHFPMMSSMSPVFVDGRHSAAEYNCRLSSSEICPLPASSRDRPHRVNMQALNKPAHNNKIFVFIIRLFLFDSQESCFDIV
jgi:hypothetical protein